MLFVTIYPSFFHSSKQAFSTSLAASVPCNEFSSPMISIAVARAHMVFLKGQGPFYDSVLLPLKDVKVPYPRRKYIE
jgi:vesicle coat complex subunit